jgi:hypothetical protein
MTTVHTWVQDKFLRPRQDLYRRDGDFYSLDEMLPSLDGRRLQRSPTFGASHITYPTDFDEPLGAVYDEANDYIVIVGASAAVPPTDRVGAFTIDHADFSKSSVYTTASSPTDIGGIHKSNVLHVQNGFWFVGTDGDVYLASDPYGQTASNKYGSGDANALIRALDTIFLLTTSDEILRWNTGSGTFETLYDTWLDLGGQFITFYRNDFILLGYDTDGSCMLYRIDALPPANLRQIARLEPHTGQLLPDDANADFATPWALYDDDLYFSPGLWVTPDDVCEKVPIYRYTGSRVELVDTLDGDITPHAWGLTTWRDRLLLYLLDGGDQRIYVLHNDKFTQFLSASFTLPADADIYSVGGELAMITTVSGNDGVSLTRYKSTSGNVFTSSWLDMGAPASRKHLSRLACMVTGHASDLKVKIEYRTEAGSWTTATEQDNVRHVDVGNLGVQFYLLQLRVTFTEDISPATYPDVYLENIAATYSVGIK